MIDVSFYIHKLKALRIWLDLWLEDKYKRKKIIDFYFETGFLIIYNNDPELLCFDEWYQLYGQNLKFDGNNQ